MKIGKNQIYDSQKRKRKLERAKGFEPSTPTLARLCSTPELHPQSALRYVLFTSIFHTCKSFYIFFLQFFSKKHLYTQNLLYSPKNVVKKIFYKDCLLKSNFIYLPKHQCFIEMVLIKNYIKQRFYKKLYNNL